MPPKKRTGPKPKPAEKLRDKPLSLKFTQEEKDLIGRAAELDKDKPHNWARRMLLIVSELRIAGTHVSSMSGPAK